MYQPKWSLFYDNHTQKYDCLYGLANGIRANIGGHFQPRGDINNAVFNLIETTYKDLQRYEQWLDQARAVTDIALITAKFNHSNPSLSGAANQSR